MAPRGSRDRLASTLNRAFAAGLLSENTLASRMDEVLHARLIEPGRLVGDIWLRAAPGRLREHSRLVLARLREQVLAAFTRQRIAAILALDWDGQAHELLIGRASSCDLVLAEPTVSRRHARVTFRDGRWVFCDLGSTNGSFLNGRAVGRCELRPGDTLSLGRLRLRVD